MRRAHVDNMVNFCFRFFLLTLLTTQLICCGGTKKSTTLTRIHFDSHKAFIRNDMIPLLDKQTKYIKGNKAYNVIIEGHSDEAGSRKYNDQLAQKRAEAVKEYFVRYEIKNNRLNTVSYGKSTPLCKQRTPTCRFNNRRVELRFNKK